MKAALIFLLAISTVPHSFAMGEEKLEKRPRVEQNATFQDIEKTMGKVPTFLRQYPQDAVAGLWNEFKSLELNKDTALEAKYKELIAIAVAAQVPCRECVYFHTEAAKLNKASKEEIQEAVALAGQTRHWSTWLNGMRVDDARFKLDVADIIAVAKKNMEATNPKFEAIPITVTDATTAYIDIDKTLGKVPEFLRLFPESGLAGAWKNMKDIQMSPNANIPGRYRELIGLAVSAQIPCAYCTHFHSEFAKLNSATAPEMKEAVAIASLVREMSTLITGSQVPEATTKKDVDQIIQFMRAKLIKQDQIAIRN